MHPLFLLLSACTPAEDVPTWHGEVAPVVQESCVSCHDGPGSLSGIDLSSYESASPWADAIGLSVANGSMPPWGASDGCNDYLDDFSLTEDERATIVEWAEGGAPEGDPDTAADIGEPWRPEGLARVDRTLELPVDYMPVASPDDYRCFLMDWPEDERVWVTGFDYEPGNTALVHHIISFIAEPGAVETFEALDAADPEPGYACYGGPGGDVQTLIETGWLGAWAPGSGGRALPEGHGIAIDPGSKIVVQMHYYVPEGNTGTDRSKMQLQIERTPQAWANIQPWTDVPWLFGQGMEIPPQSEGVEHEFVYTTGPLESFRLRSANLHMHTLGRTGRLEVEHADGTTSCLLDIRNWDFDWQRDYYLESPVRVGPGDSVRLRCSWDNPTDEMVQWGDGTGDEMCLGITLMTD
jgi:hypothetical protein